MKRFNFVLTLIFILSLVFTSIGSATSIRMDELTNGSDVPPATSWFLIGYNGTTAYRMTYLSLLGVYFDAPGAAGGMLYSNGNDKWERITELTNVTIGGFSANNVICADSSGNLKGCTNISGDYNFALVASPTFTGTVTLPASTTLTTPIIGAATGTSLLVTGIIDGKTNITNITTDSTPYDMGTTTDNKSHYYFVKSAQATFTFTLPTPEAGIQYCFKNVGYSEGGGVGDSQLILDAPAGVYIELGGTWSTSGGTVYSVGAAGEGCCLVGAGITAYVAFPTSGTWNRN